MTVVASAWLVAALSALRGLPALWGRDVDRAATPVPGSSP
jgi:hypothetical protein